MRIVLINSFLHIFVIEVNTIENINSITKIISNIILIIGGFWGVGFLKGLKEKSINATFGYYTMLKIRINYFLKMLKTYKDELLDRLIPDNDRVELEESTSLFFQDVLDEYSSNAAETLSFLKNSDDQIPTNVEWISNYDSFIEFLNDATKMNKEEFHICKDERLYNKFKTDYYDTHIAAMEALIREINTAQEVLCKKMDKERKLSNCFTQFKNFLIDIKNKCKTEKQEKAE